MNDLRSPPDIVLVIRGELQRREMTDIAVLADPIQRLGLIYPIGITCQFELAAGALLD